MTRISGHAIDPRHIENLEPIPTKIHFYVDGYGARLLSQELYDSGGKTLESHLRLQKCKSDAVDKSLYDRLYSARSAEIYAEIFCHCLSLCELYVVSAIENERDASGKAVFPNALLVNQSNPLNIDINGAVGNLLEALYPTTERALAAEYFVDVTSEGTIFSPAKIDRDKEKNILRRRIESHPNISADDYLWMRRNLESIEDGVLYLRNKDGAERGIDFGSTEKFYDVVFNRIGNYSRSGQLKVHWSTKLSDFGEKGVDCDIIMRVMDDLYDEKVDVFVFVTNDMDFFPLLEKVLSKGKRVFLCASRDKVSNKLIHTVGERSFFDLSGRAFRESLPAAFMAMEKPEIRSIALQWAWLALRREQKGQT